MTLAAYPLVPKAEVGFRVQLTAINTDAEVDTLIAALTELAERGELQLAATNRSRRARAPEREHSSETAPGPPSGSTAVRPRLHLQAWQGYLLFGATGSCCT